MFIYYFTVNEAYEMVLQLAAENINGDFINLFQLYLNFSKCITLHYTFEFQSLKSFIWIILISLWIQS
jgi:hypothetical protein